ncbi:protein hu-li tai shao-like isoform X2 [Convolutriloba macropyga]|uniref:protein hu-li tai shao-like isoform X2 n=1 Tax=Convolutriloba macropyga TaxID=536237 RepID=UPI003F51F1E9
MPSAPKQDFQQEFKDKKEKFMTNGAAHEEEDFEKPAAIEADIKDMEKRKRVSYIMNSDAFRTELENIIDYQLSHGPHPASVMALQHLADMLLPSNGAGPTGTISKGGSIAPIADLRGVDASSYSKGERFLRCKLASLFRLIDQEGWNEAACSGNTHISARVSGEQDSVLINPSGLHFQEVSATTLVKVDQHGNVMHPGSTTFGVSKSGTSLHTALHRARPDVRCILHLKQADVQAVSSMKHGLLRTSVDSCVLGNVSTQPLLLCPSSSVGLSDDDKESLTRELGAVNKVMLLANQGAVVCGATIEETWQLTTHLVQACKSQMQCLQAAGGNVDNLNLIPEEAAQKAFQSAWAGEQFEEGGRQWKFGEMLFEIKMREFDNQGYRSGYIYKNPLIKVPNKPKFDVETPAASSSLTGYYTDGDIPVATRNTGKKYMTAGGYHRLEAEVLSDGDTPAETKIKWVRKEDGDASVKVGVHDFAPTITSKQEMKNKISTMKDDRDLNKSNSGHTSRILDGLADTDRKTYSELQGSNPGAVAAFSKGIIQREHQKEAVILTDYTAQNPFDQVTDDELNQYQKRSDRIAQGLPAEEPAAPVPAPEPQQSRRNYQLQQAYQQRYSYGESSKKDKKARAATMPHPGGSSPTTPTAQPVASDTEKGLESGLDKGITTGGETETEQVGTLEGKKDKKGKPKKEKSFKMFGGGSKKSK